MFNDIFKNLRADDEYLQVVLENGPPAKGQVMVFFLSILLSPLFLIVATHYLFYTCRTGVATVVNSLLVVYRAVQLVLSQVVLFFRSVRFFCPGVFYRC